MANEAVRAISAAWHTLQAATSTANGAFCSGARTAVNATSLSATEELYPLLDLRLTVSAGTPTENGTVDVFMRPKGDGTNESPAPAGSYKPHYVGSFVLDNTAPSTYYYIFGVPNSDPSATYYMFNNDGTQTLTIALACQARTYGT